MKRSVFIKLHPTSEACMLHYIPKFHPKSSKILHRNLNAGRLGNQLSSVASMISFSGWKFFSSKDFHRKSFDFRLKSFHFRAIWYEGCCDKSSGKRFFKKKKRFRKRRKQCLGSPAVLLFWNGRSWVTGETVQINMRNKCKQYEEQYEKQM